MVIIDPNVEQWEILAAGVNPNTEIHILDPNRDGTDQITEILSGFGDQTPTHLTALHIISHGAPGTLYLGSSTLELDNIQQYRHQLEKWEIAHLYIYGCKVAAGDAGVEFIEKLQQITQANIAASNSPTGNAAKGGNWKLEIQRGEVSTPIALKSDIALTYQGILGDSDLDTAFDTDGIVTTDFGSGNDRSSAMTIDSNGKILVAGQEQWH